jgi:Ser/Thr protein kinase RdoA (MazF antagonist)
VRRWWVAGDRELQLIDDMFEGLGVDAELDFLHQWHARLVRAWPLGALDDLPAAWVHGDYHGRNMVFVGDRLTGLFDFDVLHRGSRIEDIAMGFFTFGRESHESGLVRPNAARLFVRGYERLVRLTETERRALPMMVIVVQARTAARYNLRRRLGEDPARVFRTHVDRMKTLDGQMASLGPAIFEG